MTVWIHDKLCIRVRLNREVVWQLAEQRQLRRKDTEAGGPLFSAAPARDTEVISSAGPFPRDRRSRYGYLPHRPSVQSEIDRRHIVGQHFIGTWHTHPSPHPVASGLDVRSIATSLRSRFTILSYLS